MENLFNNRFTYKIIILLVFISALFKIYAQTERTDTIKTNPDTIKIKYKTDTLYNFNQLPVFLKTNNILNDFQPDTISRDNMLWLPLKNFEDIFNYSTGYLFKFMDVGQIQHLSMDQLDYFNIGVYRNGRMLNDLYDGSIDFNLFSKTESAFIEHTKLYSPVINNFVTDVNTVQNEIYQYRPYSELNFQQDRQDNLYVDANYHQNLTRKFNFNFGVVKHSYSGRYINAEFDKWLGRLNLNYLPTKNIRFYAQINYAKINRNLNEGLDYRNILNPGKDILFESSSPVINPEGAEERQRFDIDFGGVISKKNGTATIINLYAANSYRHYDDAVFDSTYLRENTHWINYGGRFTQLLDIRINKNFNLKSRSDAEYNYDIIHDKFISLYTNNRLYFLQKAELSLRNITLSAYIKGSHDKVYENKLFFNYGIRPEIDIPISSSDIFKIYGSYSVNNIRPSYFFLSLNQAGLKSVSHEKVTALAAGIELNYKTQKVNFSYYRNVTADPWYYNLYDQSFVVSSEGIVSGFNAEAVFNFYRFNLSGTFNYNFKRISDYYPEYYGNAIISYKNKFFKNKLELKIGFNSRFWSDHRGVFYNGRYNMFSDRLIWDSVSQYTNFNISKNITLDFFVIGKMDKAAFSIAVENIFDIPYLNTAVYPYTKRGGFANIISRFTLTWYFLN